MLNPRKYRELMNSYEHVSEMLESATSFMEDDWPTVVSAGGGCRQHSANLIHRMNDLCVEMRRWINYFEANAEVE